MDKWRKNQEDALPQKGFCYYYTFSVCFAPVHLLIPDKTETRGEQRFRCVSGQILHLSGAILNQVRLLIP